MDDSRWTYTETDKGDLGSRRGKGHFFVTASHRVGHGVEERVTAVRINDQTHHTGTQEGNIDKYSL